MKVSLTGANGFVGRRLLDVLQAQGHSVCVLTRNSNASFPAGTRVVRGDLTNKGLSLKEFVGGSDIIFHCAGEIRNEAVMYALHVDGTRRLLDAVSIEVAERERPMHWVQLSSVGAYGPPEDGPSTERIVTESSPTRPKGIYEQTKTLSDELVQRFCEERLMSFSIVRPSAIIGPRMPNKSLYALSRMVDAGFFFYIGKPGAIAPYVHVDDVVEVLMLCGRDVRARGGIFNLSNDCLLEELISAMALTFGRRAPRVRLPEKIVRMAVAVISKVVRFPLTQERVNALVARSRYPHSKLGDELGFKPRKSVPVAIAELIKCT